MKFRCALALALAGAACALFSGCISFHRERPRPGRTTLSSPLIVLQAKKLGTYLVIEAKWDKAGPWHFLIDTGSTVTHVSPEFAQRYGVKSSGLPVAPEIRVKSTTGATLVLAPITVRRIQLGDALFEEVPAVINATSCAQLSAHLGVKIDGILGFPLFRETLLTFDYPRERIVLAPSRSRSLIPGVEIPFNNNNKSPIISVRLGDRTFIALLDSGSDSALSINPIGLRPLFRYGPREGTIVSTLTGDHPQQIGRLDEPLSFGSYVITKPIADLSDDLSAIGGAILENFTVTFDQEHNRATFHRDSTAAIPPVPRRSAGISFAKTPAYWRVAGVVPDSPADSLAVEPGDLVTRINGEPVERWDFRRYEALVAQADRIAFTFLSGTRESEKSLRVFDLVP